MDQHPLITFTEIFTTHIDYRITRGLCREWYCPTRLLFCLIGTSGLLCRAICAFRRLTNGGGARHAIIIA